MLALGEEGEPAKSLLRQLTCSRRRATRAAAATLGGRRVGPLRSQQEAMKAGKELLLEEIKRQFRQVLLELVPSAGTQLLLTHLTRDQRRRSSGRLLRGL
jgi:hypothetical protein